MSKLDLYILGPNQIGVNKYFFIAMVLLFETYQLIFGRTHQNKNYLAIKENPYITDIHLNRCFNRMLHKQDIKTLKIKTYQYFVKVVVGL